LILHGPPGNGKTISLKAAMNELYKRKFAVPTLYVKSLVSYAGPEQSLNQIFTKARAAAPCFLVFEDLDSLVSDDVRSFFLNQVDGLSANDGILMVGSTNHLERLDPGISKRPSRFDRKYLFPNPNLEERILYAEFWRKKLGKSESDNASVEELPEIKFPEELCEPIAQITDKFSFAYIQEAFVATLLQIARGAEDDDKSASTEDQAGESAEEDLRPDLDNLILWKEFKKQVKILKEQMGNGEDESSRKSLPVAATTSASQGVLAVPMRSQKARIYRP
jgi:transitional endoplasmic reticulum ATPase